MKVLVTGTAGFIGHFTALRLIDMGHEVVGLDSINDYYDINLKYGRLREAGFDVAEIKRQRLIRSKKHPKYQFCQAKLEEGDYLKSLFESENFDAVCNLAAQAGVRHSLEKPQAYVESNIVGFVNILEACRDSGVKNLSYASSSSVYGLNESMPFCTSDSVNHPVSLYAASKKSNELLAHTYAHLFGISCTGLRFFTVYGPWGRPDMAPYIFTKAAFNEETIKVFNHGKMKRDFTYIDDIVDGVVRVIENPCKADKSWDPQSPTASTSSAPYKIYNIGNNEPVELLDFINAVESAVGKKIRKEYTPMQPGDVVATYADVSDMITCLGYKPSTSVKDGMVKTVEWYRSFYNV
ncbi:NAD-dependent epimerase [Idiomarina baltica]|uniref:Nucleoside-diphosphate-sugar epimerase n=1 Tax=Idiomarina baltica OS145 TaxID=314276 RepID=A0ABM9WLW5_9GAMM|nr:NAD-dependent epimerase [Idiomarina baltica]EAQ31908.1 Nucleoside-diphosphate-sugar epimerase [Idiomarina baltica OS145]